MSQHISFNPNLALSASVTHPNFIKFGCFSLTLSVINILDFFSKFELVFAVSAFFHDQLLFLVYVFYWNNEHILRNIIHI